MEFNLTTHQRVSAGFGIAAFVLMLLGAFRGTETMWGQTAVFLSAACLWWAIVRCTGSIGFIAKLFIGSLILVASLSVAVLCAVIVMKAIQHIDPMQVWVTLIHYLQTLVLMPKDIYEGARLWIETGDPAAFRRAGCGAPHLFFSLFIVIALSCAIGGKMKKAAPAPALQ